MTYSVVVHVNGTDYSYPAGPFLPGYNVDFQPDNIYFWLDGTKGGGIAPNPAPFDLGPHSIDILKDGVKVFTQPAAMFLWRGGWRYPIVPDVADLSRMDAMTKAGLLLPYGNCGLAPNRVPPKYTWTQPPELAGLTPAEPAGGERDEIGHVTEQAAHVMRARDLTMAPTVFAQASGLEQFAINMPDPRTKKPWNFIAHPLDQTAGGNHGTGAWIGGGPASPMLTVAAGRPSLDRAHSPAAMFPAWLFSGNPRHVQRLQLHCSEIMLEDDAWSKDEGKGRFILSQAQDRALARGLNRLLQCLVATRVIEASGSAFPDYLLPSTVYDQLLDNQLEYLTNTYMNNPCCQVFRQFANVPWNAHWQHDYILIEVAYAALIKPNYRPFFKWAFHNVMARASKKYGYGTLAVPSLYRMRFGAGFIPDVTQNSAGAWRNYKLPQFFTGWDQAWDFFLNGDAKNPPDATAHGNYTAAMYKKLKANPDDPNGNGSWFDWDNFGACDFFAVLSLGVWLDANGIVDLRTTFPELPDVFAAHKACMIKSGFMWNRLSFDPTIKITGSPPVVIPPPPPPVDPVPPVTPPVVSDKAKLTKLIADIEAALVVAKG